MIIVVGGGVAGMATALGLRDAGKQVLVLESAATAGGKVHTVTDGEWRVELGPMGILDDVPATQAMVQRLGLEIVRADDVAKRRYMVRDGLLQEAPSSPPKILTSKLLRPLEKLRLLGEVFTRRAQADEPLSEFFARHVGRSLADSLVDAMPSSVYAGDWTKLSTKSAFPRLWELDQRHGSLLRGMLAAERQRKRTGAERGRLMTLRGGMGTLSSSLAKTLGTDLRTGAKVQAIEAHNGQLHVRVDGESLAADRVILAVPAPQAAELTRFDALVSDAYRAIPMNGIAAVTLGFRRADLSHPLDAVGFLVPRAEGERLLGALWMTSTFPGEPQAPKDHVNLRCMIGGSTDPDILDLDDQALIEACLSSLQKHLGAQKPVFTRVDRWHEAIAQYELGHAERVETIEARGERVGVYSTGAALRGVGVNDILREARALTARL